MLRAVVVCGACLVGWIAVADDISPKAQKVIELGEIRRKERLSELEGGVRLMKDRLAELMSAPRGVDSSGVPVNPIVMDRLIESTRDRIAAALREIESVKSERVYYPNIVLTSLHEGEIGVLVDQFGAGVTAKIDRIIDDKNMIVTVDSQAIWLTVSTRGLKPGKQLAMTMPFEVLGTTTHKSVGGGSKKMFVLQPFHLSEADLVPNRVLRKVPERLR